ncbi:MAG: HAD family phosphatase [Lachnospiraceae bacterium]|nr:HAD family phosphatase [Lachnospiraceae bacterium]
MQDISACIFDLDGTLVDSMWMWKAIDIEYLGKFGIPMPEDLQKCIEGISFDQTAIYFKEHFPIPDPIEKMKEDWNQMAWDKYANEVPLKPGVADFLKELKKNGIKLGIASSNSRELMDNVCETHGLHAIFDVILTSKEVAIGKPAPDIYLKAARELGISPSNCLVFEDLIAGIQAGKAAGMKVVAVDDEYSAYSVDQKKQEADYYLYHYDELLRGCL